MSFSQDPTQGVTIGAAPGEDPTGSGAADATIDPTLGRQVGELPYEDPTQGARVGELPYEDPTQGVGLGSLRGEDPMAGVN